MATLFPGLSLFFASGLSSPGLLGCLAMCLRYADLLYLWLCAHSLLEGSWAFCLSFALQLALVLQVLGGSPLPYSSHPSRWGHPCGVEAVLSSIGTKVFFFFYEWEHRTGSMCPFSSLHPLGKGKEVQCKE